MLDYNSRRTLILRNQKKKKKSQENGPHESHHCMLCMNRTYLKVRCNDNIETTSTMYVIQRKIMILPGKTDKGMSF